MRILTFTSLFPNTARPRHGVFVANRLKHLMATGAVEVKVIAPVPVFPLSHRWAHEVPVTEIIEGIEAHHPRALIPPVGGMYVAPSALARAGLRAARKIIDQGFDFELIDAHYMYPDGVAAARIARALGKPLVITVRGTDINVLPDYGFARKRIRQAAESASHLIAVSGALKAKLLDLGVPDAKVSVLPNGVDREVFRFVRCDGCPNTPLRLLTVGNLVPEKGLDVAISAVARLPGVRLDIIGDGPERAKLERLAASAGATDRVKFVGTLPHADLPRQYNDADLLLHPSAREGSPNVVLEALACGLPVIASKIEAHQEVLSDKYGAVLAERTPEAFSRALLSFQQDYPDRARVAAAAVAFDWAATSAGQLAIFRQVVRA